MQSDIQTAPPCVITEEIFGQPTDFLFERKCDGADFIVRVTWVMPEIRFKDGVIYSLRPQRWPW